jgi:hypothetical protein
MTTTKVLQAIEKSTEIATLLSKRTTNADWGTFTRTLFNLIAKKINQSVTQRTIDNPYLLNEHLLFGEHKYEMLLSELNLTSNLELLEYIRNTDRNKPFNWISGKTLQSYWSGGNPKELKINVLLVFLDIPVNEWDQWKHIAINQNNGSKETATTKEPQGFFNFNTSKTPDSHFLKCISKYYLGSYFLYYLKSDNQRKVVKAPFIIYEDKAGAIFFKTINEGQHYSSYPAQKMGNALCLMGKNLDWEEIHEMHLINIGMETKPEVLFGVSITMSKYGGFPMALKNVLVYQNNDIHFLDDVIEKEINLEQTLDSEETTVLNYFNSKDSKLMFAEFGCSMADFNAIQERQLV